MVVYAKTRPDASVKSRGVLDKISPTENLKFADYKLNFGSP